jgi:hypothetical protein
MNARTPQSPLSATLRFAVAAAVATVLALASLVAVDASHDAVQIAGSKFSRATTIALPTVEVVMRRHGSIKG